MIALYIGPLPAPTDDETLSRCETFPTRAEAEARRRTRGIPVTGYALFDLEKRKKAAAPPVDEVLEQRMTELMAERGCDRAWARHLARREQRGETLKPAVKRKGEKDAVEKQ